jgi:hypothetical protein
MDQDERRLWTVADIECVMISCCTGAELQVRRGEEILVRELYPMKSDLYERARELSKTYEDRRESKDRKDP